jgi:hypothetical protein
MYASSVAAQFIGNLLALRAAFESKLGQQSSGNVDYCIQPEREDPLHSFVIAFGPGAVLAAA